MLVSDYRYDEDTCNTWDLSVMDGDYEMAVMRSGLTVPVRAVLSGDLTESEEAEDEEDESEGEGDHDEEYFVEWIVHDGDLWHLENEPFTGKLCDEVVEGNEAIRKMREECELWERENA